MSLRIFGRKFKYTTLKSVDVKFSILVQAGVARRGKAVKRLEIPISESICDGMKREEIAKAEEKERWLMQQDLKMEQTKDKKNALESYVYEMRDKVLLWLKMIIALFSTYSKELHMVPFT